MAQAFYQGGNEENYTIGGVRFFFNRNVDLTVSPVKREGFKDLGNVVTATNEQAVDILDHFTAKSGTRMKDRSLVREITDEILLTLDEPNVENLRMLFRAGDVTDVAAATATGPVTEVMQLNGTELSVIGRYNPTLITVEPYGGGTPFILNTDYELVTLLGGLVGIKRKGSGITDHAFVEVDYKYDTRAHKKFMPATDTEVIGQALFFAVSDTGNEFTRSLAKVQVEPEGGMEYNSEDWSSFQLRMKILDNSDAVPTEPFGTLEHYGTGANI